jgi:hypothetical protein
MTAETGSACQTAGGGDTTTIYPWGDDPRATEKTALFEYVRENPLGVRPSVVGRARQCGRCASAVESSGGSA